MICCCLAAQGLDVAELAFIAADNSEGDFGRLSFLRRIKYVALLLAGGKAWHLRLMAGEHHFGGTR